MWAQILNAALAAWLVAAPDVLGYAGALRTNDRVAGPVAATCALVAIWETTRGVRRAVAAIGAWLVVAPWVLGAGTAATADSMAVGALMIALALAGRRVQGHFDGGWRAVVGR